MTSLSWSEERWRLPYAAPRHTETGSNGYRSVLPSTSGGPHLPPNLLPLPRCGRGRGRVGLRERTLEIPSRQSHTGAARPNEKFLITLLEHDQEPSFLFGHVPYPCCMRGCQYAFAPAMLRHPSIAPRGRRRGKGKVRGARGDGEGRQACSSASALNPVLPVSSASKRHMRCPLLFPEPFWR